MEKTTEISADNFEERFDYLEQVYGGAFWALQAGATKEDLVGEIDDAFECLEEMKKDGRLIGVGSCSKTSPITPSE